MRVAGPQVRACGAVRRAQCAGAVRCGPRVRAPVRKEAGAAGGGSGACGGRVQGRRGAATAA